MPLMPLMTLMPLINATYATQMGISSEFLRRRVLSAIAGLAEGEDSARSKLEGGAGSFFADYHTRLCPIMSMPSRGF